MSENGHVNIEVADGVGTVSFFHPKKNSLPGSLLKAIASTIDEAGANNDVKVVVLQSEGEGPFCAGASFDELLAIDNFDTGKEFFMGFARLILAMRRCPKFIIARIQGKTVGGGVGVAAAADYALATKRSAVRLSELAIGIGPFVVGPAVERKVGTGAFTAFATDADWRDAEWACTHGLYAAIYDDREQLDAAVAARAKQLAGYSPEAMRRLKAVCWHGTDHWETLLEERAEESGRLILSDFAVRAIEAFKRR